MDKINVLVVGSGGREHAIVWSLQHSACVNKIWVAPGNAGTDGANLDSELVKSENVSIQADDISTLLAFAREQSIGLTVVGPETPLAAGLVDAFDSARLCVFGPTRAAARLEWSKAFAKAFMRTHGIPTAEYASFTDYPSALHWLRNFDRPVVVKADGLAAGKGVIVCDTPQEAESALHRIMLDREFGASGESVILEERLSGPEVSVLAFCDGRTVLVMPPARDHKRVFDGDRGPNTGGMGAYSPVPEVDASMLEQITKTILQPAIDGMATLGTPYLGVLYAGLMLTPNGPKTLEFNCRLGDPETQALLPLLQSDLVDVMLACIEGKLAESAPSVRWHAGACATIVLAAHGYPGSYTRGTVIHGLEAFRDTESVLVFHAGTQKQQGQVVTSGGRVLAVSALGKNLDMALYSAYRAVDNIHFDGMHYRRDIGRQQR